MQRVAKASEEFGAQQMRRRSRPVLVLEHADDQTLLATRLRDLPVRIEGTLIERRVRRLYRELEARDIAALPHVYLAEEFFNPEAMLGFAVPFYLAHPRLMQLERSQMLEVEGAGESECRRIFRHEAGHAIDEAYRLYERAGYAELFGDPTQPYPASYTPRVESREHVINLTSWYAQAHPVEDFAETFAVWLNPYIDWRADYALWPARRKLEYVDQLMREIAGKPPLVSDRTEIEPLCTRRRTLGAHYARKREYFAWNWPANYDQDLRRIFSEAPDDPKAPRAARFLRRVRPQLRTLIADGTGVHAYAVDQLLRQMIARAQKLDLRVTDPHELTIERLLVILTMQTAGVLHKGVPKVAL